jgi:hypothetical protein
VRAGFGRSRNTAIAMWSKRTRGLRYELFAGASQKPSIRPARRVWPKNGQRREASRPIAFEATQAINTASMVGHRAVLISDVRPQLKQKSARFKQTPLRFGAGDKNYAASFMVR